MICNTCARYTKNEEANFCENCGNSFREHAQMAYNMEPQRQVEPEKENSDKPITFLNWLGTYGLLFIPFVSWVMIFVWAFGNKTSPSKKNWARATLIFMGVLIIIMMLLSLSNPMLNEIMDGSVEYNGLSDGL